MSEDDEEPVKFPDPPWRVLRSDQNDGTIDWEVYSVTPHVYLFGINDGDFSNAKQVVEKIVRKMNDN